VCFDEEAHARAVAEGMRRVTEREPPGYMDKNKDEGAAVGDYLVWEQVLVEAEGRKCDVVFVTADVKEDWWRREAGELRGPRLELVDELRRRADSRLFMLRPTRLLELAREVLEVIVQDESVEDADRVDRLLSDRGAAPVNGGWTEAAVEAILQQLDEEEGFYEAGQPNYQSASRRRPHR
jgi:PIN like domain